nr:interferon alpha/beta receptor 2-like isoform X1 [Labrus bergylta]XP_029131323.1 interferon alpha/beta receptor 2-like isoform X1 [Labrus bergylta]
MLCVFVVVCLSWPLCSVLSSLPAPIITSMDSVDLHHVLHWEPGPRTPKGTKYKVFTSLNHREWKPLRKTLNTSLKVELDLYSYNLAVMAVYKKTTSIRSKNYTFSPLQDSRISPAQVLLSGCGNCLTVNVSLADPKLYIIYDPTFRVRRKKPGEAEYAFETSERSFTISNLEKGVEYCVQVDTEIRLNKNTKPSAWNCSFTSILEPRSTVPVFLGAAAALVVVVVAMVTSIVIGLRYSGFLCKLKANMPRALQQALSGGYTQSPETTVPDHVSISSEKRTRLHNPPTPQPAVGGVYPNEEEEEEEEVEEEEYMDRGAEPLSSDRSCPHSASGNSGSSAAVPERDGGVTEGGLDQDEDEEEEVSVPPGRSQTGTQGHQTGEEEIEEIEEEEVCDSSSDINLFSVTLSAFSACEEEEEEEEEDEEEEDRRDLLDVSHTHTNTAVTYLTETDTPGSCEEEEEEEEEEEGASSGYMRHS